MDSKESQGRAGGRAVCSLAFPACVGERAASAVAQQAVKAVAALALSVLEQPPLVPASAKIPSSSTSVALRLGSPPGEQPVSGWVTQSLRVSRF